MIAAAQTLRQTSFQLFQHSIPVISTELSYTVMHFSHTFISVCLIHLCDCMTDSEDSQFSGMRAHFAAHNSYFFLIFYWTMGYLYVQPCVYHARTVKWVLHEHLQDVSFPESAPGLSLATSYTCSHEEYFRLVIVADLAWRSVLSTKTSEWVIDYITWQCSCSCGLRIYNYMSLPALLFLGYSSPAFCVVYRRSDRKLTKWLLQKSGNWFISSKIYIFFIHRSLKNRSLVFEENLQCRIVNERFLWTFVSGWFLEWGSSPPAPMDGPMLFTPD